MTWYFVFGSYIAADNTMSRSKLNGVADTQSSVLCWIIGKFLEESREVLYGEEIQCPDGNTSREDIMSIPGG